MLDLNITGNNDDSSNDELPMTPPATKPPAEFEVWPDEEQTPVKKHVSRTRRAPLTDISLSIGTPTMPAVLFNTKQLGPLMTRLPRKAISRSRLVVVSPFPQCQHYWDEYANDTFNYLLEIESRYDRYLYFDEHSEFGDYRATLVQWIIELCYGWFKLPPATLHVAANMEVDILKALKFEILVASATGFSDYIQRAIVDHEETRQLIDIAAAAVWISLCAIGLDWNEDLAILTGYSRNDLSPCSIVFSDLVLSTTSPLDLRATLSFRYPVEQTMATLRTVLAR
ncbi:hypothetical protein BG015_011774 [Linnemannia schmuckeri]|uniref:Uncharacterized protein n=1 Tax=Linnemannia schmuckeri TaxID=64567 RepID=A0A9P5RUW2_9FUNG|nr:hypothetical protein BG015_011774 [Linnemannia schmuckeri]